MCVLVCGVCVVVWICVGNLNIFVHLFVGVSTCACVCMCVWLCVHGCMCAYVCLCVSVCVCLCFCVSFRVWRIIYQLLKVNKTSWLRFITRSTRRADDICWHEPGQTYCKLFVLLLSANLLADIRQRKRKPAKMAAICSSSSISRRVSPPPIGKISARAARQQVSQA